MESRNPYIGQSFGNYRILAEIACGSFGCTYLARHMFLGNRAAVKLLHASRLDSPKEHESFLQEARFLKMLEHPHVLPIYDFGVEDGLPYLVTSYAAGGSLSDVLKKRSSRPLPIRGAVALLTQVGQALQFAHDRAVVHRDIKPANILVDSSGGVLLADFGIAAVLAQTGHVSLRGTPAYMAPEQFEGIANTRSDQYILGCVAYELVTGRHPFPVAAPSLAAMWYQHTRVKPISPSQLNPYVPLHIEQAILKAMAKRYELRHTDVAAFIRRLYAHPVAGVRMNIIHQTSARGTTRKSEEGYVSAADAFYYLERYEEALAAYQQAIRLAPNLTRAYCGKGDTLFSMGRYEEALMAYKQVAYLIPDDASIQRKIRNVLHYLEHFEEVHMSDP